MLTEFLFNASRNSTQYLTEFAMTLFGRPYLDLTDAESGVIEEAIMKDACEEWDA